MEVNDANGQVVDTPQGTLSPEIEKLMGKPTDNGSGNGKASVVPEGVAGWGWGPFFWSWIWAISNRVPMGYIALVPYVGLVMMPILGAKGRVWAWQNRKWNSVEDFNKTQRLWSISGAIFFVISVLVMIWAIRTLSAYLDSLVLGIEVI